jgi:ABC-2 type transport system ATP-binding protein
MIKIENLSKKFGTKKILDAIHLEFKKGKIYVVVGENGAGKTTLFKCISGLETSSGKISSDFISLKNTLGLFLTEHFFFPKITGKEYLQLLTNARQVELQNVHDKNIFDLPLNQYASTYSTGMQKKLALTAILLQKTRFSF